MRRATGRTAPSGTTLVAFNRTAEIVRDYVKKGSKLYIEGKIQTRSWDDKETGAKRYRTEIIVNDLSLLSGRDEGSGGQAATAGRPVLQFGGQLRPASRPPARTTYAQSAEISDDDIPF